MVGISCAVMRSDLPLCQLSIVVLSNRQCEKDSDRTPGSRVTMLYHSICNDVQYQYSP